MKTEFENSVRRLSILYHLPDIKITWINPWVESQKYYRLCEGEQVNFRRNVQGVATFISDVAARTNYKAVKKSAAVR